jgi:hypothetical protein
MLILGAILFTGLSFAGNFIFIVGAATWGYILLMLQQVIHGTAMGEDRLPNWPDFDGFALYHDVAGRGIAHNLRERLVLIGQDCECELDRAWLSGPLLPGRWDRTLQQTAARTLGFDPENPVVRAEVSRIIERGPQANQRKRTPATSQALGYSEESIEEPVVDPSDSTPPTDPTDPIDTSEVVTTPAPPASIGVPPAGSAAAETSGARRAWIVLAGAITAALAAGTWLFFRSTSR